MTEQTATTGAATSALPADLSGPLSLMARLRVRHVLWLFLGIVLLRAVLAVSAVGETFILRDNDDLMRLVVLRDWLGGQAWFDPVQHRLLPPDGVPMHWSRYVDAGIAAFLVPFSWVTSQTTAEALALTAWPTLLLCLLMTVTAWGVTRLASDRKVSAAAPAAVAGALVLAFGWTKLGATEFAPGRIDHHNLQILLCTTAAMLSVVPGSRPGLYGVLAGAAAAGSLAIGLEMLPVLLLLWGFAGLRFAFGLAGADRWLTGFGLAIGLGAPILMAGQTPFAAWSTRWCDVLAPPMLSLIAAGLAATLPPVLLARRIRGPMGRIALMAALAAAGLVMAGPMLLPCLAGPYSAVSDEAKEIIASRITEALPLARIARGQPVLFAHLVVPVVISTAAALILAWQTRATITPVQWLALAQMMALALAGLGIGLTQNRAINIAVPAVPFLAGFAAARLAVLGSNGHLRGAVLSALPVWSLMLTPALPVDLYDRMAQLVGTVRPAPPAGSSDAACRSEAAAATLAALPVQPRAIILSPLNLGTMILMTSPHSATSAPYHRSADAFWNGIVPFEDEAVMVAALRKSGATHVAVCRGETPETHRRVVARLLESDLPPWLVPEDRVAGTEGPLVLFRTIPSQLDKPWD